MVLSMFDSSVTEHEYTTFDFETTGFDPIEGRIIECGAVRFTVDGVLSTFQSMIKPDIPIPTQVTKIHGIGDKDVAHAPSEEFVIKGFLQFSEESILIAHNANFDLGFLHAALKRIGKAGELTNVVLDTLFIARKAFPQLKSYKLSDLQKELLLSKKQSHRALDDAYTCMEVFIAAVEGMGYFGDLQLKELTVHN